MVGRVHVAKIRSKRYTCTFGQLVNCALWRCNSGDVGSALKAFVDGYFQPPNKALVIGAPSSEQSQVVAELARYYKLPQIGYANTSPLLADKIQYPYYVRVITTFGSYIKAVVEILEEQNWRHIGLLTTDYAFIYPVAEQFEELIAEKNINIVRKYIFKTDATDGLIGMKQADVRIFVVFRVDFLERPANVRMECLIHKYGLFGPKYQWIFVGSTDFKTYAGSCPETERKISTRGSISFKPTLNDATVATPAGIMKMTKAELMSEYLAVYPNSVAPVPVTTGSFYPAMDALWTAALAINKTLESETYDTDVQLGDSDFKRLLFQNIIATDFAGSQGRIRFDNTTGDPVTDIIIYQVMNLETDVVGHLYPEKGSITWTKDLWFSGGVSPNAMAVTLVSFETISVGLCVTVLVLSSLGICLSLASIAFNFAYSHLRFVKLSSPNINSLLAIGCLLGFISAMLIAANAYWPSHLAFCWLKTLTLSLGYSLAFGAMFSKTWRVHMIFTNIKMKRMNIKDWHLLISIIILLLIDAIVFIVWYFVDPIKLEEHDFLPMEDITKGVIYQKKLKFCQSRYPIVWSALLCGVKGLVMLFGIFFAWETRKVYVEALNDSKQIGFCIYNVTVIGLVGVALSFILPLEELSTHVALNFVCIFTCSITTLALIFGNKVFQVMRYGPSQVDDIANIGHNATSGGDRLQNTRSRENGK